MKNSCIVLVNNNSILGVSGVCIKNSRRFGGLEMKTGKQKLVSYNLRKALLYLQRAKLTAIQEDDKEVVRDVSVGIFQISSVIKKINREKS